MALKAHLSLSCTPPFERYRQALVFYLNNYARAIICCQYHYQYSMLY